MRRRRILILILILSLAYVGGQLWDIHRVGHLDRNRTADCAIVLGAAAWHDKPSPVLRERLNHAIELFKSKRVNALILTGGFGKGADFSESKVSFDYCLSQGVPASAIRVESESTKTYENLSEAKKILQKEGWKNALLVSDPWHLKRARRMADDLDVKVYASATKSTRFQSTEAKARFLFQEFYMYHNYLFTGE
ncbi:MAG: YdcF family protein [Akkermansiaceae bacterium]|nr:YdcF family protein [Akkermansiaceae bacterium]